MNNNYKIIRSIHENVFQRILECKDNDTGEIFYTNIITSEKVINLINTEDLKKINSNILECYNTEDRIYIFTKPLDSCKKFREYVTDNLTLKQQFNLTEKSINLATNIFKMTDVVQQKILDLDRLYIDENNDIVVDCNLIFEQEYDIADNETFKRLGNLIHIIFSGTEIIDYNISDSIPPDILKIIVRCLTREYIFPEEALKELKTSSIYTMIFGEIKTNEPQKKTDDQVEELIEEEVSQENVLDIYLEGSEPEPVKKKNVISKDIKRAVVSLLIVVAVLLIGNTITKKLREDKEAVNPVEWEQSDQSDKPDQTGKSDQLDQKPSGETDEVPEEPAIDSTLVHFNNELLEKTGYSGNLAEVDKNIFLEGSNSLLVSNTGSEKIKALFAAVDFTDERYNYMLMQQIGVSAKIKSQKDVEAQVVFEAYKDGVIKSNFHTIVNVYDDIWSPFTVPINVTDAELLYIYLEYEGENKVWIDSLLIDVIK